MQNASNAVPFDRTKSYGGRCPVCGAEKLSVGPENDRGDYYGRVTCRTCKEAGLFGRAWLDRLLFEIGAAPNEGGNLLAWPFTFLAPYLTPDYGRVEPLPSLETLKRWSRRLHESSRCADQRHYLHEERRIPDHLKNGTRGWLIGWNGESITFPVRRRQGHEVINVIRRAWPPAPGQKRKYLPLMGHRHAWYPSLPRVDSVIVVAGMLDVLLLRSLGLPAVASTSGASLPHHLIPELVERDYRRIVFLYDLGEEEQSSNSRRNLATALRAAGADTRRVMKADLPELLFENPDHNDLSDWYLNYEDGRLNLDAYVRELLGLPERRRVVREEPA